ncbi:putative fungal Zn(2)-cys(6) binuclear cluster domain protein [Rhizoctonia solani 123E]|uniref:Putative fungal Zn(2)-cys(6) binuclear cluster domain protein n=1 Tax=Rhizoctonia solani 123E TaxID=1423351 RepID=A0A074RLW4_9AGAM|nr:putative fungal Zn(2)-cys(6) binuclear cluster domain protein [Rhizoctonia solani 123E]
MSASRRSTTGCFSCKARRKKCSETKPQCLRCAASGTTCVYEYIEYPEADRHRVKRTRPGPRTSLGRATSQNNSASPSDISIASSSPSEISGDSTSLALATWSNGFDPNWNHVPTTLFQSSISPVASQLLSDFDPIDSSLTLPEFALLPADVALAASVSTLQEVPIVRDEDGDEDIDPEGVLFPLYPTPALDKNAKSNALPFVLHCYSEWALVKVFEPLKLVYTMREQVMAQFSSENTRTRTILIANIMDMFAKKLAVDDNRKTILNHLVLAGQQSGVYFTVTPPSSMPDWDRQNAMRTLDSMLEIFSLQVAIQSIDACLESLDYAAPIFRRACSEPPEQPVNLANLVLQSNLNLRHFATVDIIQSVTTGRPTYIQYEVPFSLELCERIYQVQNKIGLQWLHGFPDQFILLFAWIISMCEMPGGNNAELIAWVETCVPQIRIALDESGDPVLRIGRLVVQECWRFAVLIFLYMALGQAHADDPRVIRAQKGFMRLVRGVKPRRNPDSYLFTPMIIAGVATTLAQDQDTLRQRILGVRECAEPGTVGNDVMLELEDVWARTRDQGRPAVWSDLRLACFRVTGR